jgi:putative methyltransferase
MKSIHFLSLNALQFVPYAYGLLRSFAKQDARIADNYTWQEPITRIQSVETTAKSIGTPDILCASCYVWNHNQQSAIAKQVKRKNPRCRVVFGGPHVPDDSNRFFFEHPYVDVLVHGEGELPFYQLLLAYLDDIPQLDPIPNISYNVNQQSVKNRTAPGLVVSDETNSLPIPSPFLDGAFEHFLSDGAKNKIGLWETNRGCPYSCSFCDWGVRSTNKIRRHDMRKVAAEIDYIARRKIEDLYVTDCNFGILKRDLKITDLLVQAREKYGYPKRVRIQFAKNSNDTVFDISRLLHANDMLWGTTLSMQSVDENVLAAVNRRQIGTHNYQLLKEQYRQVGIPTYTELILGLPNETRESFIAGICTLLEIGIHDDIRVYELALLPNAPLSQPPKRKEFNLKTKIKPLRIPAKNCEKETVEIVFETNTMPYKDWAYCFLFGETVQALHNGGYTRFLAIFLNDTGQMSYQQFYNRLLTFMLHSNEPAHAAIKRVKKLIDAYYHNTDMPQIHKILTQPDMSAFLATYNPKRTGWHLWTYLWLAIGEAGDAFYGALRKFLDRERVRIDKKLDDLLRYQHEIMLTVDFDPTRGKEVTYQYNWFDHFFHNTPLVETQTALRYTDTHMGITNRYPLEKNNRLRFVNAAIGISYPYTKFRHFFHQPDQTEKQEGE